MRKYKYLAYNSRTGRTVTVHSSSEANARAAGRRAIGTKAGTVRAYRLVKKKR